MRSVYSLSLISVSALFMAACTTTRPPGAISELTTSCAALAGVTIPASAIGIPSGAAVIDSATLHAASSLKVDDRNPDPRRGILPALPAHCQVVGRVLPLNAASPPVRFQVNLPAKWNGRSVQYGGNGFNGALINALGLLPSQPFDSASALSRNFVTYGTDSGHESKPGQLPQAFALDDEALENFAHASYKKVRDVAVAITRQAYGRGPDRLYFAGSSEGGREALTMAQRYPKDFDGIFSRVPVIGWTSMQHAGLRDELALMGDGWLPPTKVKLVHDAVLAACDAADGLADGIVSDPVGCRSRFNVTQLRCTGTANDTCLTESQVKAVQTLNSPLKLDIELANGLVEYPGRGPSGEGAPSNGPAGGWLTWWTGRSPPTVPVQLSSAVTWWFGAGSLQYFIAKDPSLDVRRYDPAQHAARVRQVSSLMDSTDPDLSAFAARGGKLMLIEHMADYAQSPYMGIAYHASVVRRMGLERVDPFFRLYAVPGADHVGQGAPANIDVLPALVAWTEEGKLPQDLTVVEQDVKPPFGVQRSRPLCEWPLVPRYVGSNPDLASSFTCAK